MELFYFIFKSTTQTSCGFYACARKKSKRSALRREFNGKIVKRIKKKKNKKQTACYDVVKYIFSKLSKSTIGKV